MNVPTTAAELNDKLLKVFAKVEKARNHGYCEQARILEKLAGRVNSAARIQMEYASLTGATGVPKYWRRFLNG